MMACKFINIRVKKLLDDKVTQRPPVGLIMRQMKEVSAGLLKNQAIAEWLGQDSSLKAFVKVGTISENVRRWLYRKGFLNEDFLNEEDILGLQQLSGGSIPQAIHMLFSSIPETSKKPTFKGKGSLRQPTAKTKHVYQKSCIEAVRTLYLEKYKEREKLWANEREVATSTYAQEAISDRSLEMAEVTGMQDDNAVEVIKHPHDWQEVEEEISDQKLEDIVANDIPELQTIQLSLAPIDDLKPAKQSHPLWTPTEDEDLRQLKASGAVLAGIRAHFKSWTFDVVVNK